jgi:1-acyl-sn-glycerol-3-phosphate acyltransferase
MVNEWMFHFCRNALRLPVGVMIRKIHFDGVENFTKDVPILLASNHPNSFFDGVVFEHISGRHVYTLARGDAFLKPKANYILRSMRILPIFRARDTDPSTARDGNARTMDELYERFKLKHGILIFSEGVAYPEKALRPLKNGTSAIAIEMAKRSDFTMNLHVVPTALNYTSFWPHIQKTVHVTYEKPIPILEYTEMIKQDEKGFIKMLNGKVQDNFERNVVITKGEHTAEKEFAHDMVVNANYESVGFKIKNRWELSIAKLNGMNDQLANAIREYQASLTKNKVLDSNVGNRGFDYLSAFVAVFTFGFSLPIFVIWWVLFKLNDRFVKRKYKNIVFRDAVKAGVGMLQALLLTIGVAVITAIIFPGYWWILFTTGGMYGAICWFRTIEAFPHLWSELQWLGLSDSTKKELLQKRQAIIDAISA